MASYDVAGLGNALVDALVRIDDDSLLGELDLHRGHMKPVDHDGWRAVFDRLDSLDVEIQTGGSCANTLSTLSMLGSTARFCGQVGDDELGQLYSEKLSQVCGGHVLHVTEQDFTGKCLSIISEADAERTMLTDLGAAVLMKELGTFTDILRDSRMLHITGYLFLGPPMDDRAQEAFELAQSMGIPISIDVADPFVVSSVRGRMWEAIEQYADIVFLNEEEAKTLCECDVELALHRLGAVCRTVVLKLGARGSVVRHDGKLFAAAAYPVDAIDTTGAGDAYAGGFLHGMLNDWDPARSADLGSRVAALTVGQIGAVCRDARALRRTLEASATPTSRGVE